MQGSRIHDRNGTRCNGRVKRRGLRQDAGDVELGTSQLGRREAIIASGLACPAAQACVAADIDGHADWYLPSRRELALCFANVPDLFKETWYWSSTQYSDYDAWSQNFDYGSQTGIGKKFEGRVRLVRRIQLSA